MCAKVLRVLFKTIYHLVEKFNLLLHIKNIINLACTRWGLDDNEKQFIKALAKLPLNADAAIKSDSANVLLQMPNDYFYLSLFYFTMQQLELSNKKIIGLWHQNVMSAPREENLQWLRQKLRYLLSKMDKSKWRKLYATIKISSCSTLEVGFRQSLKHQQQANRIWQQLTSKQDVLDLVLNGTHCGDLIYDTYLRYRVQPTVDISDYYLRTIIAKALNAQYAIRKLISEESFDYFFTSYSSYIQHGIPVREALLANIKVYSAGNLSQHYKQLSKEDTLHVAAHWNYKQQFLTITDKARALQQAQVQLENRFGGGIDKATMYMKISAYSNNQAQLPIGVDGVVFLHDFFDSPHCYRDMLFADFWEWVNFTLAIIEENKLNIAVKPHPNQLPESSAVVEELKQKYPTVQWLDSSLSNKVIFASGIKCGISVYGTILHELAYHGIPALSAGDHPHSAFDIVIEPQTIQEYKQYLLNYKNLPITTNIKTEILKFYYMHNINCKEDLPIDWSGMDMRSLEQNKSIALIKFMKMYKPLSEYSASIG